MFAIPFIPYAVSAVAGGAVGGTGSWFYNRGQISKLEGQLTETNERLNLALEQLHRTNERFTNNAEDHKKELKQQSQNYESQLAELNETIRALRTEKQKLEQELAISFEKVKEELQSLNQSQGAENKKLNDEMGRMRETMDKSSAKTDELHNKLETGLSEQTTQIQEDLKRSEGAIAQMLMGHQQAMASMQQAHIRQIEQMNIQNQMNQSRMLSYLISGTAAQLLYRSSSGSNSNSRALPPTVEQLSHQEANDDPNQFYNDTAREPKHPPLIDQAPQSMPHHLGYHNNLHQVSRPSLAVNSPLISSSSSIEVETIMQLLSPDAAESNIPTKSSQTDDHGQEIDIPASKAQFTDRSEASSSVTHPSPAATPPLTPRLSNIEIDVAAQLPLPDSSGSSEFVVPMESSQTYDHDQEIDISTSTLQLVDRSEVSSMESSILSVDLEDFRALSESGSDSDDFGTSSLTPPETTADQSTEELMHSLDDQLKRLSFLRHVA